MARGELDPADTVMTLLKDVDLLRRGGAFVGTFRSVSSRLFYLSRQGRLRRPPPYISLDVETLDDIV